MVQIIVDKKTALQAICTLYGIDLRYVINHNGHKIVQPDTEILFDFDKEYKKEGE